MAGADSAQVQALQMRVDELTERMMKMEIALDKANALLDRKWQYRSSRDDLMIELFKMLRQSMDNRLDTLLRVSRMSK